MKRLLLLLLAITTLSSCVTGPKRENDKPVDYLNGKNYSARSVVSGFPYAQSQAPVYKVTGRLVVDTQPLPEPLKYQAIVLKQFGKEITRANTDLEGKFVLSENSLQNGRYLLVLESERFAVERELEIKDYETADIELVAKRK